MWGRKQVPDVKPEATLLWEPSTMFPDTLLLTGGCGCLFTVHIVVWMLLLLLTKQSASQAHLGAHFVATLLGFSALAVVGVQGWILHPVGDMDRTLGHSVVGAVVVNMMVAFQLYEVVLALIAPRLRGKHYEMLGHHVVTLYLALLGGSYGYLHYYGPFFFGVSELSSVQCCPRSLLCAATSAAPHRDLHDIRAAISCAPSIPSLLYPCRHLYCIAHASLGRFHSL